MVEDDDRIESSAEFIAKLAARREGSSAAQINLGKFGRKWSKDMSFRGRGIDRALDFRQLPDAALAAMLARQSSIYSLTFDEFQSTMGGFGKDFGSMNMDEFLKNVWTAEESQAMEAALRTPDSGAATGCAQVGLLSQGSLTLPRTLSLKTVDEVWRGFIRERDCGAGGSEFQPQPTLGEMTLEEFLVRSGVVREEMTQSVSRPAFNNTGIPAGGSANIANGVFYGDSMAASGNNNTGPALGFPHVGRSTAGAMSSSIPRNSGANLSVSATDTRLYAPQLPMSSNVDLGCSQRMRGGGLNIRVSASPMNQIPSDGRSGDRSSLSPLPCVFNGGFTGKRSNGAVEKTVERRQRRMIKNRESAARSRARKQVILLIHI
ncbi:ABSCISIC ACID-INSENSITIVE 5-like protein 5 [Platanthera guangdongensis]|uniref:ABSCISIC ACID-INSENSITIVE 5-like protein 5 n=1 Tax=Platanthera guangdongensis TaxID=2320717 RepID=A0ABR2MQG1_9ASPA